MGHRCHNAKNQKKHTRFAQIGKPPGSHHSHLQQEEAQDTLERADEKTRRHLRTFGSTSPTNDHGAQQQDHTPPKHRLMHRFAEGVNHGFPAAFTHATQHDTQNDGWSLHHREECRGVFLVRNLDLFQVVGGGDECDGTHRSVMGTNGRGIDRGKPAQKSQHRIHTQGNKPSQNHGQQCRLPDDREAGLGNSRSSFETNSHQ